MSEIAKTTQPGEGAGTEGAVERSFETPGAVRLRVENASGRVEIETHDAPTTDVRVVAIGRSAGELVAGARITERTTSRGHEVVVEIPQGRGKARFWSGDGSAVGVSVRVPPDAELDVSTASASVGAAGAYRAANIKTASGEIVLGYVAGEVRVRTASGALDLEAAGDVVDVQSASGDVRVGVASVGGKVTTASGDVDLGRAGQLMRIHSASGDVRVGEALEGARVETVSGDQRIERASGGDYILRTVSGDILVAVVPGALIRFDTGSMSGRVSTDIEVEPDRPADTGGDARGPELLIQAKTVSGDITVTRAGG
ncbi:MAG TPA: DUF4097 family beta strand repeat-containing protein [Acidimicrobiales bacterium]|nr:DUF4097 family beta strand repeat-containing protein [Acidimicrobiales bacterium]